MKNKAIIPFLAITVILLLSSCSHNSETGPEDVYKRQEQITHTDNPNDTGVGWGLFTSNGTTYYYPGPTIYFAVTK